MNVPVRLLVSVLPTVITAGVIFAQPARTAPPPAPASRPAMDTASVDRLLRGLSQPDFNARREALAALCDLPFAQVGRLIEIYNRESPLEVRLGLRTAIEHAFFRHQLEGRMGFLGFELQPAAQVFDPRRSRTVEAILVRHALTGFPAAQAGVRTGDLILEFEGKTISDMAVGLARQAPVRQLNAGGLQFAIPASPLSRGFTAEVSRREPGTQVHLRLVRREKNRELMVTLPQRPERALEGAKLVTASVPDTAAARNEEDPRATLRAGLLVTNVEANSTAAALGLQSGDVIIAIGRMPLSPSITPDLLTDLFSQSPPGTQADLLLCHMEERELTVTLGGRPVDLMNPEDLEVAQERFAEWWKQQTGEASVRTTPASLRLIPGIPRSSTALPDPTLLP